MCLVSGFGFVRVAWLCTTSHAFCVFRVFVFGNVVGVGLAEELGGHIIEAGFGHVLFVVDGRSRVGEMGVQWTFGLGLSKLFGIWMLSLCRLGLRCDGIGFLLEQSATADGERSTTAGVDGAQVLSNRRAQEDSRRIHYQSF